MAARPSKGSLAGGALPFWRRPAPPRLVLVSDLDHTMVQNEDPAHRRLLAFNAVWQSAAAHDSLLVYSTGRSPRLYRQLWEEAPLLTPAVLICSVGTEVFYLSSAGAEAAAGGAQAAEPLRYEADAEWEALLDEGWERGAVLAVAARFPELRTQVASEQRRHKLSFHLDGSGPAAAPPAEGGRGVQEPAGAQAAAAASGARQPQLVLQELQEALRAEGLRAKVVYSGGRDVDVLAEGAGKGAALAFLLGRLRRAGCAPPGGVQVNGDSGNDIELFQVPGVRGCVVANAFPELRHFAQRAAQAAAGRAAGERSSEAGDCAIFQATEPCAGGILQALRHFGSLPPECFAASSGGGGGSGHGDGSGGGGGREQLRLRAEDRVMAAVHTTLAALAGPLPDGPTAAAGGGAQGQLPGAGAEAGGEVGAEGGAEGGGHPDGAVAVAAAAAAAAGVWVDRLQLEPPRRSGPGEAGGGGEWTVRCQVFRLESGGSGRRDTGCISRIVLAVRREEEEGEEEAGLGSSVGGDGQGAGRGGQACESYTAEVRSAGMGGLKDVALPPGEV